MKKIIVFLFLLVSQLGLSQVSKIEQQLTAEEKEYLAMQDELASMKNQLIQRQENFNKNANYIQLKNKLKAKKSKVKQLRKQFKDYKQAQQRMIEQTQSQAPTPKASPSRQPTKPLTTATQQNKKQEIKLLKQKIKALQKRRKEYVNQALIAQQNPATNPKIQQIDKQIATYQSSITALKNGQTLPPSSPTLASKTPNNLEQNHQTTPTNNHHLPSIALNTILFDKLSTQIDKKYVLYINAVAKQLQENPELLLSISSFTDNTEKATVSLQLTEKMAHNTAQLFVERGISPNRILLSANGSKQPIAENKTFFGQARNRRVELQFVKN